MKKIILTVFAASSLLLYSTQAFALLSVSVGMPLGYSFTQGGGSNSNMEGYFLGVQLPFALGLGMDSHKVKSDTGSTELHTNMYNLFYQLPIPVINLILGVGTGSQEFICNDVGNGKSCSDALDKGSATQFYTSLGIPIMPLFDFHISYRSITTKDLELPDGRKTDSSKSTVMGAGFAFNF